MCQNMFFFIFFKQICTVLVSALTKQALVLPVHLERESDRGVRHRQRIVSYGAQIAQSISRFRTCRGRG